MSTKLLELLAKYRQNQATPEEIAYIKERLAEFQELQDLALEEEQAEWEKPDLSVEDQQFKQKINRQIKKNWFKTLFATIGILLVLTGIGYFALPKIVDQFTIIRLVKMAIKLRHSLYLSWLPMSCRTLLLVSMTLKLMHSVMAIMMLKPH